MEIFACVDMDTAQRSRLERAVGPDRIRFAPESEFGDVPDSRFTGCEVVFGGIPPAWLAASQTLRWVQLDSTGFDEYIDTRGSATGIMITNLAGFFAAPVAESCLAGILALHRGIDRLVRLQEQEEWVGHSLRPRLRNLAGSRVVLFGYGSINRRLAELLRPFDCAISAFASDWRAEDLDLALREADIVACAAPETTGTTLAFDRRRIAMLKPDAIFANFGRGSLVDESALAEALSGNRIAGAVIDVTETEPLPAGHPLWRLPNLLLTQHSGGGSTREVDGKIEFFAANLERYRRGEKLQSLVDLGKGY